MATPNIANIDKQRFSTACIEYKMFMWRCINDLSLLTGINIGDPFNPDIVAVEEAIDNANRISD